MTLCSNGQKPTIEWQYTGEDKQRIIGADNYTVGIQPAQCPVAYNIVTRFQPGINKPWREYIARSQDFRPPFTNFNFIVDRGNAQPFAQGFPGLSVFRASSTAGFSWNNLFKFTCTNRFGQRINTSVLAGDGGYLNDTQTMEFIRFERADGLPDNCGDCVFTVTKNNQVVYTRTKSPCPTVTHFCGEQCPPGTCQCDCGTEVCCYDTKTGKAVKSFRK